MLKKNFTRKKKFPNRRLAFLRRLLDRVTPIMFFAVLSSILLGASVPLNHTTPDNTAPVPAVPSENDFASENTSVAAEYFALVDADGDGILTANENRRLPWQEDEAPGVGELHGFPSWYDSNDGNVTLAEDDGQGTLAVDGAAELEEEVDEEVEASATESQLFVASTQGDYADIPSFSEEQGWSDPSNYGVITGVRCSGKYCDSMQLKASQIESTNYSSALTTYTEWFSEENSGSGKCAPDYVVTAVKCKGRYCDSLRLRCNKLKSGGRWTSEEYETSKFSSSRRQSGIGECYKPSTSVIGIKCFGDYCGQKKLICRGIVIEVEVESEWRIYASDGANPTTTYTYEESSSSELSWLTSRSTTVSIGTTTQVSGSFKLFGASISMTTEYEQETYEQVSASYERSTHSTAAIECKSNSQRKARTRGCTGRR